MKKKLFRKLLGVLLVEKSIITQEQLEEALRIQKEKGGLLGEILVSCGFAKEEDIAYCLSIQYNLPFLPLENYTIDESVLRLIPKDIALKYEIIPIDKLETTLTVSMADPSCQEAIDKVISLTELDIQVFVSTASDIKKAIEQYYK